MTTHHLTLTTSTGAIVQVPVRLPASIRFDCYVPGVGVKAAWLEPTTLDPDDAAVRTVDVGGLAVTHQARGDDAAIIEQATAVLDFILIALHVRNPSYNESLRTSDSVLTAIADLAHANTAVMSALERTPGFGSTRNAMAWFPDRCLARYIDHLCDQAHLASTKEAKRREALWLEEHTPDTSHRTDAAIDRYKDERP